MLKNLNKIKNELKDESNEHSNKLKNLRKQNVENEKENEVQELTGRQIEIIKIINQNKKKMESNLINLINKQNDLLKRIEDNNNYNEIINDYNELKLFKNLKNKDFDYFIKKNEINKNYLNIRSESVNIYIRLKFN